MIGNSVDDSQRHPERDEPGDDGEPSGSRRSRKGVPRWIAVVGCCVLVVWACLTLYDYQHVAAPAARRLWSLDASDRLAAIHDLEGSGRVDTGVAIPALVRALKDKNAEVRTAAAMALVSAVPGVAEGDSPTAADVRAALDALVKSLNDPQPAFRAVATRALWMVIFVNVLPPEQVDVEPATIAVTGRLDDPDPGVRLVAIQGLGFIGPNLLGDPPARLVAVMGDDSAPLRAAAVEALAVFYRGLPPLIPTLAKCAERAAAPVRADYVKLLGRIRPPKFSGEAVPGLISALASTNPQVVAVAASDLTAMGQAVRSRPGAPAFAAVRPLLVTLDRLINTKLHDKETSDAIVAVAAALGRLAPDTPLSDETVTALAAVLRTGDSRRRAGAAAALGRFHPTRSLFSALVGSINDQDGVVRVAVLQSIHDADFGAPFVIPKALESALEDESPDVRVAAAAALGHAGLGDDSLVRALFRHAEHDVDTRVRQMCSATLHHLRDSRKLPAAALPALPIDRHDLTKRPHGR